MLDSSAVKTIANPDCKDLHSLRILRLDSQSWRCIRLDRVWCSHVLRMIYVRLHWIATTSPCVKPERPSYTVFGALSTTAASQFQRHAGSDIDAYTKGPAHLPLLLLTQSPLVSPLDLLLCSLSAQDICKSATGGYSQFRNCSFYTMVLYRK